MATQKQKKFIHKLSENVRNNGNKSLGKIAREAGYSEAFSKQPSRIINARGTRELADKIGLSEDYLLQALKKDIASKPGKRERELDMGFKIHGSYSPEKHQHQVESQSIKNLEETIRKLAENK